MPKLNETQEDILNSFVVDDEDANDLGTGQNEDDFDDQDDLDESTTGDVDDDDIEQSRDTSNDDPDDDVDQPRDRSRRDTSDGQDDEDKKQQRFSFKEDRAGNFVDKDGKVIFRAGKQREIFVKLKNEWIGERKKNKQITQKFAETVHAAQGLLDRYKNLKAEKTEFDGRGLSQDEIRQAADLAVMFKVDPKAGVRKLLTMLHMNGTDLKDIGVTGPVDAAEVARIIEERSKPKEKDERTLAREEAQSFLHRHPAAERYTGLIAQAKQRYPNMSLDEIWFQLIMHASKRKNSDGDDKTKRDSRRTPDKVPARNGARDAADRKRPRTKLSLSAVDPSQSFSQIGRDLLKDIQALEGRT